MRRLRLAPDVPVQQRERSVEARGAQRDSATDTATAVRWARYLDNSAKQRLRADLAAARERLSQARTALAALERERDASLAEAATWQRKHADAVRDCADITVRRDVLIDSMAPAMTAILLAAALTAWDEGWESAATESLVQRQNPYRRAAAGSPTRPRRD